MVNGINKEEIKDTEPTKDCGHTGKYLANGQNIAQIGTNIIVLTSSVCGECGQPTLSVNKIEVGLPKPSGVVVPPTPGLITKKNG